MCRLNKAIGCGSRHIVGKQHLFKYKTSLAHNNPSLLSLKYLDPVRENPWWDRDTDDLATQEPVSAGGKVACSWRFGALRLLPVPSGACGWGQTVSPGRGLYLDLAPASLHRLPPPACTPVRAVQQRLRAHRLQALVLNDWEPWPRESR